jgi:hypothetical protein
MIHPKTNIYSIAKKPMQYRRVIVDLKIRRCIEKYNTIICLIGGDLTIITKG